MNRAETEEKIRQIVEKIVKEYQPEKIILFGSWAWGTPHEDSDVDLLIIKCTTEPRFEREKIVRDILIPQSVALDLLIYTPQELEKAINEHHNIFLEDIVRNGKVLHETPGSKVYIARKRELVILH